MDKIVAKSVKSIKQLVDLHFAQFPYTLHEFGFFTFLNTLHDDSLLQHKLMCFSLHLYEDVSLINFNLLLLRQHRSRFVVDG
jgi:hypothetical protein